MEVDMDIKVDYHDSSLVAHELKLIRSFSTYNCRENTKIVVLSSTFWRQIAGLNQLFGLEETKMVMYIITCYGI